MSTSTGTVAEGPKASIGYPGWVIAVVAILLALAVGLAIARASTQAPAAPIQPVTHSVTHPIRVANPIRVPSGQLTTQDARKIARLKFSGR